VRAGEAGALSRTARGRHHANCTSFSYAVRRTAHEKEIAK